MYKLAVTKYDYLIEVEDLAVFDSLHRLYEYTDFIIKSNNKYSWEYFTVTEFKNRKWYEQWINGKRVKKQYEEILSWSQVCYLLDNHIVK